MTKSPANLGRNSKNSELLNEIQELRQSNEMFAESYSALARASLEFDEQGWSPVNRLREGGFTLEQIKSVSSNARLQVNSNPLLKRGANLRASYVFGRGFKMSGGERPLASRFQKIVNDPINQQVLFSEEACKQNEKTLFTDGNFFVRYDISKQRFGRVPLSEIAAYASDRDDPEIVQYYLREYSRVVEVAATGVQKTETVKVWYPVDTVESPVASIGGVRVDRNFVLFDRRENVETGNIVGVPDCLSALPWAWAYSEYLKDGSKMLKALSAIAWQVKAKTSKGAANASAKVLSNRQVASTAVTGADVELSALPRNNAVDLGTGQPLAAMAATAMEVSVDALLAGSGLSGGGGSQVLDQSTLNAAYGRQGNWERFFVRVLRYLGVQNPTVKFNAIIVDPTYRNIQSLGQGWMTGLFAPDVIQAAYAEQLGIEAPGLIPDGVLIPNNENSTVGAGQTPGADMNPAATNVATSQGNSGAGVGDLTNSNNDARDFANNPV
jgi:hypothetical protein